MSHVASATLGWVGIGLTLVSMFVSIRKQRKLKKKRQSYTYGDNALQTSISNTSPIPIIYGNVKVAGNLIYSRLSGDKKTIYKVISLCDGEINSIKDLEIDDLDINSSKFSGVSYNTYLGTSTQLIDSRVEGSSQTAKAEKVGGLKNLAYVALQANANENLSGNFNFTCLVEGCKVKKYTNAVTREYVEGYSNNPAWCVLDFLTRYNGCGMSLDEIDLQSFINGAEFFDKNNYTLNLCLDEQRSRLEWVQYMLNCCRSLLVYRAGKYSLFVEKKDEVVQRYTPESIVANSLNIWFSPLQEVPDVYRVTYVDPENEWVKVNAEASLSPDSYLRRQPLVETMELLGVTNFDQASRLAWFYLNQALTCQTFIEFETDRRALNRTVGDVIEVTDYVTEFQNKKFRIIKIEDTQEGSIKLTCREYNEDIYSERKGSSSPVINITTLTDPQAPPPEISYVGNTQDYYILPDKTVVSNITLEVSYPDFVYAKEFKLAFRKVGEEIWRDGGTYPTGQVFVTLNNMEVFQKYEFRFQNISKFGKVSSYTYSPPIYIEGKNLPPQPPEHFKGEEVIGGFQLSWDKGEVDIDHYELYIGSVLAENKVAEDIKGDTYFYSATVGTHILFLIAVDTVGNRSYPSIINLTITPPNDVQGFDCVQNERNIEFHWERVDGASYYIIREGDTWEFGTTLTTVAGQFFSYPYAQATSTVFWIKSFTDKGVACKNPSYSTLQIASIPNRNQIYEYDAVKDHWNGKKFNTSVSANGLQLDMGKSYGEYQYEIDLGQIYNARNWLEKIIKPQAGEGGLIWKDATFKWNSAEARNRVWFPVDETSSYNAWGEISIKDPKSTQFISDSLSLNGTTDSEKGLINYLPTQGTLPPTFAPAKSQQGLLLDKLFEYQWDISQIGEHTNSVSFSVHIPAQAPKEFKIVDFATDKGDVEVFKVGKNFTVTLPKGETAIIEDFSSNENDFLTMAISFDGKNLNFLIYSLAHDAYKFKQVPCTEVYTLQKMILNN